MFGAVRFGRRMLEVVHFVHVVDSHEMDPRNLPMTGFRRLLSILQ